MGTRHLSCHHNHEETMTDEKKIEIRLSDRAPVRIATAEWPVIASASWHSGEIAVQANEEAWIKVRQHDADPANEMVVPHADGRVIVYGCRYRGPGGMPVSYLGAYAGYILTPERGAKFVTSEAIVRAIRRVAGAIEMFELGDECIADLPVEEL